MTDGQEVIMQPKDTRVTFSPVLPSVPYSNFGAPAGAEAWFGDRERGVMRAAGSANPAAMKLRREEPLSIY